MNNMPKEKIAIVAVSRDCFPMDLSVSRRKAVVAAYKEKYGDGLYECPVCIENEIDMRKALADVKEAGCNAIVVYLGNFGPETPETLLIKEFDGPAMVVAAAEETGDNLVSGRGDAYCGVLNASYNLKLRNLKAYLPEYPAMLRLSSCLTWVWKSKKTPNWISLKPSTIMPEMKEFRKL